MGNVSWSDKLATNQMVTTEEGLKGIWGPKRRTYDATNSVCYGVGGPHAAMDCSPVPDPQVAENQWDSFLAGCGETTEGPNGGDWWWSCSGTCSAKSDQRQPMWKWKRMKMELGVMV